MYLQPQESLLNKLPFKNKCYWTWRCSGQMGFQHWKGSKHRVSPLTKKLFAIYTYWPREKSGFFNNGVSLHVSATPEPVLMPKAPRFLFYWLFVLFALSALQSTQRIELVWRWGRMWEEIGEGKHDQNMLYEKIDKFFVIGVNVSLEDRSRSFQILVPLYNEFYRDMWIVKESIWFIQGRYKGGGKCAIFHLQTGWHPEDKRGNGPRWPIMGH